MGQTDGQTDGRPTVSSASVYSYTLWRYTNLFIIIIILLLLHSLQFFDAVGRAAGKASGL